jgi:hypothetical protein
MLDITLHDILPLQCIFAFHGDPVVLGGEFRQQVLPVAEGCSRSVISVQQAEY